MSKCTVYVSDDGLGKLSNWQRRRALLAHLLEAEGLPGVDEIEELQRELAESHTTLTRILRWARDNSGARQHPAWVQGNGHELFSALADAGFEIYDDCLVIHGERVRE